MVRSVGILVIAALVSMSACLLLEVISGHNEAVDISCHGEQTPANTNGDRSMQQCCQKGLYEKEMKPPVPLVTAAFMPVMDAEQAPTPLFSVDSLRLYATTAQHLAKLSLLRI